MTNVRPEHLKARRETKLPAQMHAVAQMPNLRKSGVAAGETELDVKKQFGPFVSAL